MKKKLLLKWQWLLVLALSGPALAAQRACVAAYAADDFSDTTAVPHVVRAFEVVQSRRPVRPGFTIGCASTSEQLGWISSGASVPVLDTSSGATQRPQTRSIGLAMLAPQVAYGARQVDLVALDNRGKPLPIALRS